MDLQAFQIDAPGYIVDIAGSDPAGGEWRSKAFIPHHLGNLSPSLSAKTFNQVSDARAALAALEGSAIQLPNRWVFRHATLRREAQSTSALEGTFAPIEDVLTASADDPQDDAMSEVLRYVSMASHAFASIMSGRRLTMNLICEMHGELLRDSALESGAGHLRDTHVMIGSHVPGTALQVVLDNARFVPCPPGDQLQSGMDQLMDWIGTDLGEHIDPIVATAMLHYQFECLHPFVDGNGRIGRLLVVLYLLQNGLITEPTLFVSPWFEARRDRYFDLLLRVSTHNDWDAYVHFFAQGIEESANSTASLMQSLVALQSELKNHLTTAGIRAESARRLIDFAISNPTFTVAQAAEGIGISYPRANKIIAQLIDLGILAVIDSASYRRRLYAPSVHKSMSQAIHPSTGRK